MLEVTIDRQKWRTGGLAGGERCTGTGPTMLLNEDGYMCCLGFAASQIAQFDPALMHGRQTPKSLNIIIPTLTSSDERGLLDTQFTGEAMWINDNPDLTTEQREESLIALFKENGIELTIQGEYDNA